jgi:hypothetical protein
MRRIYATTMKAYPAANTKVRASSSPKKALLFIGQVLVIDIYAEQKENI